MGDCRRGEEALCRRPETPQMPDVRFHQGDRVRTAADGGAHALAVRHHVQDPPGLVHHFGVGPGRRDRLVQRVTRATVSAK